MSLDTFDCQSVEPDVVYSVVKLTGNGTGQPTKVFGRGATLNRTGVGIIDIAWAEFMGAPIGLVSHQFESATQSGLKGFTVVPNAVGAVTARTSTINVTNAAETLVDLSSAQSLTLTYAFKKANA